MSEELRRCLSKCHTLQGSGGRNEVYAELASLSWIMQVLSRAFISSSVILITTTRQFLGCKTTLPIVLVLLEQVEYLSPVAAA
jgi:hypothetical protein